MEAINLNELFTADELRILHNELTARINDWHYTLDNESECSTSDKYISVLSKLNKAIVSQLDITRTDVYGVYAESSDQTFIMEDTFIDGELASTECIGWYCGEPDDELIAEYSNRRMKAVY